MASLQMPDYFSLNQNLVSKLPVPQTTGTIDVSKDYPLIYKWVLMEMSTDSREKGRNVQYSADSMTEVAKIGTIGDFWRFWNALPQPSELFDGKKLISQRDNSTVNSVMLFREGIKAAWEDPYNGQGGEFQYRLVKKSFTGGNLALCDELWNNLVLGMVGGTIKPASMITGIRLLDRMPSKMAHIRMEVWFTSLDKMTAKDTAGLPDNATEAQKEAFYNKCIDQLEKNIEECMLTRLDGRIVTENKLWGETAKSMHNHGY